MYDLIPGDIISETVAHNGIYDWPHTKLMVHEACKTKGGLLVDVGANLGYFSFLWAGLNTCARVVAFEASPRNIKLFQSSIEKNHMGNRINLIPKALGDRSDMVTFDVGPPEQTGWGGISKVSSDNTFTVPMVRLDEELPDTQIDILKIDVEGADTWVLFGCENLLKKKKIEIIYFEQNRDRMAALGIAPDDAQKFLLRMGYACHPLNPNEDEWMAYPHKNEQ